MPVTDIHSCRSMLPLISIHWEPKSVGRIALIVDEVYFLNEIKSFFVYLIAEMSGVGGAWKLWLLTPSLYTTTLNSSNLSLSGGNSTR